MGVTRHAYGPGRDPGRQPRPRTAERLAFWEAAARRLDWEERPGQDRPWHTTHRRVPADAAAGLGPEITWFDGRRGSTSPSTASTGT